MLHSRLWLLFTMIFAGCSHVETAPAQATVINLTDYLGNRDDDTVAVQNWLDAIHLLQLPGYAPAGLYKISTPLRFGRWNEPTYAGFVGAGSMLTRFQWVGPTNGRETVCTVFRLENPNRCTFGGFTIQGPRNDLAIAKTHDTVGFWCANSHKTNVGTTSSGNTLTDVVVAGMKVGIRMGDGKNGRATSEWIITNVACQYCGTGIHLTDFNSLNFQLTNPGFAFCGIGLNYGEAGSVNVYGGSASFCETVFQTVNAGLYSVKGYRVESSTTFANVWGTTGNPTNFTIDNCQCTDVRDPNKFAIRATGSFVLTVRDSNIAGRIGVADNLSQHGMELSITNSLISDTVPFTLANWPGSHGHWSLKGLRYDVRGCQRINQWSQAVGKFPNAVGAITANKESIPNGQ